MPKNDKQGTKRSELPLAPQPDKLPALPDGVAWSEIAVSDWRFKIAVPMTGNLDGALALVKGDAKRAADLFERGWRIAVPATLKVRERMKGAVGVEAKRKLAAEVQKEILSFDPTTMRRISAPKSVDLSGAVKEDGSVDMEMVRKLLQEKGITVVS